MSKYADIEQLTGGNSIDMEKIQNNLQINAYVKASDMDAWYVIKYRGSAEDKFSIVLYIDKATLSMICISLAGKSEYKTDENIPVVLEDGTALDGLFINTQRMYYSDFSRIIGVGKKISDDTRNAILDSIKAKLGIDSDAVKNAETIKTLQSSYDASQKMVVALTEEKKKAEASLKEAQQKTKQAEKAGKQTDKKISDLQNVIQRLKDQRAELNDQIADLTNQNKVSQANIDDLQNRDDNNLDRFAELMEILGIDASGINPYENPDTAYKLIKQKVKELSDPEEDVKDKKSEEGPDGKSDFLKEQVDFYREQVNAYYDDLVKVLHDLGGELPENNEKPDLYGVIRDQLEKKQAEKKKPEKDKVTVSEEKKEEPFPDGEKLQMMLKIQTLTGQVQAYKEMLGIVIGKTA